MAARRSVSIVLVLGLLVAGAGLLAGAPSRAPGTRDTPSPGRLPARPLPLLSGVTAEGADAGFAQPGPREADGVVLEDGVPVADAEVWTADAATRSGPDGRFRLALGAGSVVQARKGERLSPAVSLEGLVLQGEGLVLPLRPAGALEGTVHDAATGAPLAQVWVTAGLAEALTDARGALAFPALAPGSTELVLEAAGYQRWRGPVQVEAGRARVLRLVLERAQVLSGWVRDALGRPVAGARVDVLAPEAHVREGQLVLRTDATGAFLLREAPGGPLRLRARAPGAATPFLPLPHAATGVELALAPAARVEGRVEDAHGAPVAGRLVALGPLSVLGLPGEVPPRAEGRSAADGTFRFESVLPGRLQLAARAPGGAWQVEQEVQVEAGEVRRVTLTLPEPGDSLHGRVVAADDGRPIPGAEVRALASFADDAPSPDALPGPGRGRTDVEGRFVLSGLAAGQPTLLQVRAEGFGVRTLDALPGDAELRIALASGREVRGQLLLPDGTPCLDFTVHGERFTVSDGRFRVWVSPEAGVLLVRAGDGGEVSVPLAPGEAPVDVGEVQLPVAATARLEVDVLDSQGRPVAGTQVVALPCGDVPGPRTRLPGATLADAAGHAAFDVPPGSRCVHAAAPHLLPGEAAVQAVAGERRAVTVVLRAGGWLEGHVRVGGRPRAHVAVYCADREDEVPPTATDAQGRFRLGPLTPGPCLLQAFVQPGGGLDLLVLQRAVSVREGEAVAVELEQGGRAVLTGRVRAARPGPAVVSVLPGHVEGAPDAADMADARVLQLDVRGGEAPFRLEGLPEGPVTLVYGRPGEGVLSRRFLTLAPGEAPALELDLDSPLAGATPP